MFDNADGSGLDGETVAAAVSTLSVADLGPYLRTLPEVGELDDFCLVEVIKGWERVNRGAQGAVLAAVAELARRRPDGRRGWVRDGEPEVTRLGNPVLAPEQDLASEVSRCAAAEVALALELSPGAGLNILVDAVTLSRRLPRVLDAVAAGRISARKASVIGEETLIVDVEVARQVADLVLAKPGVMTAQQAARLVRSAVIRADPAAARAREAKSVAGRFVRPRKAVEDGMVTWEAWLPLADSVAVWERLTDLGHACTAPDDPRTLDARRADVLCDLLLGRPVLTPDGRQLNEHLAGAGKVWRTDVVVAASTLAGGDDEPALVPGWGPITADTARLLASGLADGPAVRQARHDSDSTRSDPTQSGIDRLRGTLARDGTWRRILTDPQSGLVKDYGTTRYRPPQALADYIRARDQRCYEPNCLRSAWRGDLDHVLNSPAGPSPRPDPEGTTSATNMGAGCRPGHITKSAPGWKVLCPSEGTFVWTTPSGHQYTRHPEAPLPWFAYPAPPPRSRRPAPTRPQEHATPHEDDEPPF